MINSLFSEKTSSSQFYFHAKDWSRCAAAPSQTYPNCLLQSHDNKRKKLENVFYRVALLLSLSFNLKQQRRCCFNNFFKS